MLIFNELAQNHTLYTENAPFLGKFSIGIAFLQIPFLIYHRKIWETDTPVTTHTLATTQT